MLEFIPQSNFTPVLTIFPQQNFLKLVYTSKAVLSGLSQTLGCLHIICIIEVKKGQTVAVVLHITTLT